MREEKVLWQTLRLPASSEYGAQHFVPLPALLVEVFAPCKRCLPEDAGPKVLQQQLYCTNKIRSCFLLPSICTCVYKGGKKGWGQVKENGSSLEPASPHASRLTVQSPSAN